jgi:hypothetical protein
LEIARLMRADGKSAAEIAAAFGNPRARNTVIGRLARAFGRMAPRPRQATISASPKRAPPKRERPPVLAHLGRDGVVARRHAAPTAKPPKPPKVPLTGQALADRKAECKAKQLAVIAKVEAAESEKARRGPGNLAWRRATSPALGNPLDFVDSPNEAVPELAPRRYRPVLAADNPAFVKAEKPADLYAHMRSDRGYFDAIAALSR